MRYLNTRRLVKWMTFFAILQLPIYFIFVPSKRKARDQLKRARHRTDHIYSCGCNQQQQQQHSQQDDQDAAGKAPEALQQLARLRWLAVRYNQFYLCAYVIYFTRAALVNLMHLGLWRDYHLVDCFLLGRTVLVGKTHRYSAIFTSLFYLMYALYRAYLSQSKLAGGFAFHAIEFMLHDYDEILAHEVLESSRVSRRARESLDAAGGDWAPLWPPNDAGPSEHTNTYNSPSSTQRASFSHHDLLEVRDEGNENRNSLSVGHRRRAISLGKRLQVAPARPQPPLNYRDDPELAQRSLRGSSAASFRENHHDAPDSDGWAPACNPLLYIKHSFTSADSSSGGGGEPSGQVENSTSDAEYILRLNRTAKHWTTLNNFALIVGLLSANSFCSMILFSGFQFLGPLVTGFGFETSYSSCVRWLKRAQREALFLSSSSSSPNRTLSFKQLPYAESIYLAAAATNKSRPLACDIRLDDMPLYYWPAQEGAYTPVQLNPYQYLRIAMDTYESYLFNMSFICYLSAISFVVFILALDVVLNARELTKRMVTIVEALRRWKELTEMLASDHNLLAPLDPRDAGRQQQLARHRYQARRMRRDILDVQEILVDHFKLVGQYNSYVSFTLSLTLTLLLCISLTFMVIIFTEKSAGIAVEYFFGELGSIALIIYLSTGMAATRAINVRLHALVTRAMALDSSESVTKLRWAIIMKYYHPKPLYCFTLIERTELSWLFCLKFAGWSLSAVLVLAGFLYPRWEGHN